MRGDLHTLKRVCSYASVVMLIGESMFLILAAAAICLGTASFFSEDVHGMFVPLIKAEDTDISLIAGTLEIALMFIAMFVTVKTIHDIMASIMKEHSPFLEENSSGFKTVCLTFLLCSAPLAVLEFLCRDDIVMSLCIFLACILISVVMYCLTIIFRYGSILQDESDHTL